MFQPITAEAWDGLIVVRKEGPATMTGRVPYMTISIDRNNLTAAGAVALIQGHEAML